MRTPTADTNLHKGRHQPMIMTDVSTKVCAMDAGCLHPAWRVTAHYANAKPNVYILDKKGPVEGLFVRKPKSFGEPGLGVNPAKCRLLRHLMKKTLYI
jgi:hypothetical protein